LTTGLAGKKDLMYKRSTQNRMSAISDFQHFLVGLLVIIKKMKEFDGACLFLELFTFDVHEIDADVC
jgi:hypothetical protein